MAYLTKITDYGYKKRVSVYVNEIEQGTKRREKRLRKKYSSMSPDEQKESDKRRISYYKKRVYQLIEVACMNDFNIMVTLTFREPVTDYDMALSAWEKFLKRLRHKVNDYKYICVWEYQKDRGNVFHFHCLFDFFMGHAELSRIWGYGFIWVSRLKSKSDKITHIKYMTKYIVKEMTKRNETENTRGKRLFFTSNNLAKPQIELLEEKIDLEKLIFENMEEIIEDGSYYLNDHTGATMNRCDYVEIRKS